MPEAFVVPAHCRRPRTEPISLVCIHATRGPTSMAAQYAATVNWFTLGPDFGGFGPAADALVGSAGEVATFGDWRTSHAAFAAGYGFSGAALEYAVDEVALSVEVAQPSPPEPYTDACIDGLIDFLRPIVTELNIPLVNLPYWDQLRARPVPRGFLGHDGTANGNRLGKSDPGPLFPWTRLLEGLAVPDPAPFPPPPLDIGVTGPRVERRYLGFDRTRGVYVVEELTYPQDGDNEPNR